MVDGHAGHDLVLAVVKCDAAGKYLADHRDHVVHLERQTQRRVTHQAAGGIGHLAILQVIASARKKIIVADVVVMHVADDDGLHAAGIHAERLQSFPDRLDHFALAPRSHRGVEAGVENDGA